MIIIEASDAHSWLDCDFGIEIYDMFADDRLSEFIEEYGDFQDPFVNLITGNEEEVFRRYNILRRR